MLTQEKLAAIEARLHKQLLARLALRWRNAGAYIPAGSTKVHCAGHFPHDDEHDFDVFVTGYQDAITDIMEILNPSTEVLGNPTALALAKALITHDRGTILTAGPRRREPERSKPAKGRGVRRDSAAARAGLRRLFEGGGSDDV